MSSVVLSILSQHLAESSFLWILRSRAAGQASYSLLDLAKLDWRIVAHLDGVRIAQDEGWRPCAEALEQWKEPGEAFAAALLAFESNDSAKIQFVLSIGTADDALIDGLVSALGWLPYRQAEPSDTAPNRHCCVRDSSPGSGSATAERNPSPRPHAKGPRAESGRRIGTKKFPPRSTKVPDGSGWKMPIFRRLVGRAACRGFQRNIHVDVYC
jgi:hypothetical protein